MSTTSIIRARPRRCSTSSTSRRSKCCAGRRARSTARTPPPARSTSRTNQPTLRFRGQRRTRLGNLRFQAGQGAVSGPLVEHARGRARRHRRTQPPRHDLQCHQRRLDQRAGQSRRARPAPVPRPIRRCGSPSPAITARQNPRMLRHQMLRAATARPSAPLAASSPALAAALGYAPPSTDRVRPADRSRHAARCVPGTDRRRVAARRQWDLGPGTR